MKYIKELILKDNNAVTAKDIHLALCKDAIESFDADQVSIWYFDKPLSSLTCTFTYGNNNQAGITGSIVKKENYPVYFTTLIQRVSINASDVYAHPATSELIDDYYKPNKIASSLDYIIYEMDTPIGVICCETTSEKVWTEKDVDLLRVLTVMAGTELKNLK